MEDCRYVALASQGSQQGLGLVQIGRIKALGEPAIDLGQQPPSGSDPALALPESTQAHRCPQFIALGVLPTRALQSLLKAGLSRSAEAADVSQMCGFGM